jgi:UDP-N-acetylmuramoyl-L-alanyl-D-glutamate--2,6-diaminopimelate ligase
MGNIASEMSCKVIFTSDNPRSESPSEIISEMESGVEPQHANKILAIENREQAIKTACQLAAANDIILVAGKGHETYQETNGKRIAFDDFKIITEVLKSLDK